MVIFQYKLYIFGIHLWTVLYPKPCYNEPYYKEAVVYSILILTLYIANKLCTKPLPTYASYFIIVWIIFSGTLEPFKQYGTEQSTDHGESVLWAANFTIRLYSYQASVTEYGIYPKYWSTLSTYHTCPESLNSPFYYLLMCLKCCCMYGKQYWTWSDAFCGIWSGSTLFAKAYLSNT